MASEHYIKTGLKISKPILSLSFIADAVRYCMPVYTCVKRVFGVCDDYNLSLM